MAKTSSIKASSRASIKVDDSFYTIEFCEERMIEDGDNLRDEREKLWNTVNSECDEQVEDILKTFKK